MIKEHIEIKPASITKNQLNEIYSSIEKELGIRLSSKGKVSARRDINRYLLYNNNDVNKTIEYFKNYKDNLRKLYLGYSEESLNNIFNYLYR